MENLDTLARRLKWARKERNLSQQQLAAAAEVVQSTVSKIERGLIQSPTELLALARALNCNPDWLDTGAGGWTDGRPVPAPPQKSGITLALQILGDRLANADEGTRDLAAGLLAAFCRNPSTTDQAINTLEVLLRTPASDARVETGMPITARPPSARAIDPQRRLKT